MCVHALFLSVNCFEPSLAASSGVTFFHSVEGIFSFYISGCLDSVPSRVSMSFAI